MKNKKLLTAAAVILVLGAAFYFGGNAPGSQGWLVAKDAASSTAVEEQPAEPDASTAATPAGSETEMLEGKPLPVEPQDVRIGTATFTCTLSINCATILDNMDLCDPNKIDLVPADGWILEPVTVEFAEGESVFDVLCRAVKEHKIHMEYEDTPMYNSAYIEGIANLYEFDVGEKSGWKYKVNEWFPNYGCSRYQPEDGDVICWVYTCDLGSDVGGRNAL